MLVGTCIHTVLQPPTTVKHPTYNPNTFTAPVNVTPTVRATHRSVKHKSRKYFFTRMQNSTRSEGPFWGHKRRANFPFAQRRTLHAHRPPTTSDLPHRPTRTRVRRPLALRDARTARIHARVSFGMCWEGARHMRGTQDPHRSGCSSTFAIHCTSRKSAAFAPKSLPQIQSRGCTRQ